MPTRVAFVTGGAQGLGEAIALRLAKDGLDVAILDISGQEDKMGAVAQRIKDTGRRAHWVVGDVSKEESVISAIKSVVDNLGRLDVMVANAGVGINLGVSLLDTTVEDWNTTMSINALGVMLCYKHAAKQMIKQGEGGRLIGACSIAGKQGFLRGGAYSASKFAIRGLTQVASRELREHNITVNTYAPGWVWTDKAHHPDDDKYGGPGGFVRNLLGMPSDVPTTEPPIVAGLVSYLASPEACFVSDIGANVLTGQCMSIDGGASLD